MIWEDKPANGSNCDLCGSETKCKQTADLIYWPERGLPGPIMTGKLCMPCFESDCRREDERREYGAKMFSEMFGGVFKV